ncbi:hypothetical protein ACFC1D_19335 [Streptomyces vinaceus]|uniref:ATP-binding protein n=1 Tax=Streptomyces vinaceus TaxID=1960 RepID=UPI0035E2B11C
MTIHDDGAGRARPPVPGPSGHGLIGMHERVHLLGGRLHADPTAQSWRLITELPALASDMEPQP